jgi:CheY-like chemotaxis protein
MQLGIEDLHYIGFSRASLQPPRQAPKKTPVAIHYSHHILSAIYCACPVSFSQPKPLEKPPPDVVGAKILVVDDEVAWRTILATDLCLLGYRALLANDATRALEVGAAETPDLGIIDLMLPEPLDGHSLVDTFRASGLDFPVIFYTAYPVFPPPPGAPGVINYLSKAVDRADLYALIPFAVQTGRKAKSRR